MLSYKVSRHFTALLAAGLVAAGGASSAFAQAPGSREHVQSLLDQYAPGVNLDAMNVPSTAFRGDIAPAIPGGLGIAASPNPFAPGLGTTQVGTGSADAAAARARAQAQAVLNQVVPGMVTLGEQGVRVEAPGVPVVDTRRGMTPATDASMAMLHRLAIDEAVKSLREADFARAARWVEAVAADLPKDGDVRQLESLALVGEGRFDEAAEAAKTALKATAPWDKARLMTVLPTFESLSGMLRAEARRNPADGKLLFLLAYHELMLGRQDEAARLLDLAAEQLPPGWLSAPVRARFEE